jgi:hypothetical protein
VQQPQVQVLTLGIGLNLFIGLILAIGVAACGETPTPPAAQPPATTPPKERHLRLVGEAGDGVTGPGFVGAAALLELCRDAHPCRAERWQDQAGDEIDLVRVGDRIRRPDRLDRWPVQWRGLAGTLTVCMGDPLATPPAKDPQGFRALHQRGTEWRWSIDLSGANPCGIAGRIELDATRDRLRAVELTVDHQPWDSGGRALANERARSIVRADIQRRWPTADAATREKWRRQLRLDPDGGPLLEQLSSSAIE